MEIPAENIIKHLKQLIADQAQQIAVQASLIEMLQQPQQPQQPMPQMSVVSDE